MLAHYGDFENALESSASGCILGLRNQISSYGTRIAFWMGIPQDCGLLQSMLQAMQQTATPAPASPSFAGLLAALATPAQQRALAWNDDDLADDVATLSYERALRAHARYIPVDPADLSDRSLLKPANPGPLHSNEVHPPDAPPYAPGVTPQTATDRRLPQSSADSQAEATLGLPTALERNLKSASITIRLSKAESAQLRRRAAEAGLTVSAYLRSCTFEAESLRALVKDTLAQLRSAPVQDKRVPVDTARRSWFQWWEQFWSRMRASRRIVQA